MNKSSVIEWSRLTSAERSQALKRPSHSLDPQLLETVRGIISDVRSQGDKAVRRFVEQYEKVKVDQLQVSREEIETALSRVPSTSKTAIQRAFDNIKRFHEGQIYKTISIETEPGVLCERRVSPVSRVGLYVPGGSAPLISTVLMLGVPSLIAQVPIRVLTTPAESTGQVNPHVLFAATLCGIDTVYRVGGAQGVAAMAYGTETVKKVDKIFGPGNSWVTAAKMLVANDGDGAAIDMPAGPSEVMVVGDDRSNPRFIAADVLSQLEHGSDSQAIVVSLSRELIDRVAWEIKTLAALSLRSDVLGNSLKNLRMILVETVDDAVRVIDDYASEHLVLQVGNAREMSTRVTHAGSIFIGPWTPESVGDYATGTNHVLPTYGYAKSYSGLGVESFLKTTTIQELSVEGLKSIGPTVMQLANLETLDAHARSIGIRLDAMKEGP